MATIIVTNGSDSGPGSLRQAIASANSGDTINFDTSVTVVTLTSGQLSITKNLSIIGYGTNAPIIFTSSIQRIFSIGAFLVTISNLTTTGGNASQGASIFNQGTTNLNNIVIASANGVGIYNSGGTVTLTNSTIRNCTNSTGVTNVSGTVTINNSVIRNNAGTQQGVGINNSASMFINQSTISTNTSTTSATGIFNNGSGNLRITNSTINGNTAVAGAAGILISGTATLSMYNSTIYGNNVTVPSGNGGGIVSAGNVTIINSTICANTCLGTGGGCLQTGGSFSVANSIIGNNTAAINPDVSGTFNAGAPSYGYNLIGILGTAAGFDGTNIINPLINVGLLTNNGGPTLTVMPNPGSPAINAGNDQITITNFTPIPQLFTPYGYQDQRGYKRFISTVDIGAVEFNSVPICYSGKSIVLVKNKTNGEISEIMVKDVYSDIHQVFSINSGDFVDVLANAITGPTTRYMKIKKDFFGPDQPNVDFYVTGGHKIVVDGQELKVNKIDNLERIKCQPEYVYSICTKKREPILINGLSVMAWAYDNWVEYLDKRGVRWWNNLYIDKK